MRTFLLVLLTLGICLEMGCQKDDTVASSSAPSPRQKENKSTYDNTTNPTNDHPNDLNVWLVNFGGPIDVDQASRIQIIMDTRGLYWNQRECSAVPPIPGACIDSITFDDKFRTQTLFSGLPSDESYETEWTPAGKSNYDKGEEFDYNLGDDDFSKVKNLIATGKFHMSVATDGNKYEIQYVRVIITYNAPSTGLRTP